MPSSLDSSDMQGGAGERESSGTLSPASRGSCASWCAAPLAGSAPDPGDELRTQDIERGIVGVRPRSYDDIRGYGYARQDVEPDDLTQAALQAVAFHDRVAMLGNDDTDPGMTQKGSEDPNFEVFGSSSLPFS